MPVQSEVANGSSELQPLARRNYSFKSLKPLNLSNCTRDDILEYFDNTYDLDEGIFSGLADEEAFYKCPDRLRLPLIFYLAHTATLYVNKLLLAGLIEERINHHFETMFETGVDEMSWDDTENYRMGGAFQWPKLTEVLDYRQKVRQMVTKVIQTAPLKLPITMDHPWWSIVMGMEHERIHLETSSVLIRQLPVHFLNCPLKWKYAPVISEAPVGVNELIKIPGGKVNFGKPVTFPSYGWDNEYGHEYIDVPAFEASKYKVTNREFLEFVESGGYTKKELWTEEGWGWVKYKSAKHPSFWVCGEGCKSGCGSTLSSYSHCNIDTESVGNGSHKLKYRYRAIYDVIDMPMDWPVDVNYHEAKAFCTWKGPGYRLPTEAEVNCIRADPPPTSDISCDPVYRNDLEANINLKFGSSSPVNFFPPNSAGFYDAYGNVWEWVEDQFNGLPNFKSHYLYDDFSSPCFDGLHNMMLGGSWISTGDEASRFARFSFRRHFFQHLGFRLVRSENPIPVRLCSTKVFIPGMGTTENPILLNNVSNSCLVPSTNKQLNYDDEEVCKKMLVEVLGSEVEYGRPLVQYLSELTKRLACNRSHAIVFGCGAGYTSFMLSKIFQNVLGVDYSGRLIDAAWQMKQNGEVVWGTGEKEWRLKLPEDIQSSDTVDFKQLTWIPNELNDVKFVLFEFLDYLMEPKGWLLKLWECVTEKGVVVFSASDKWNASTLKEFIGDRFELLEETKICNKTVSAWQLS